MGKAIVTLVAGDSYQRLWNLYSRPSWERYAARHSYRLIVLDRALDESAQWGAERSLAWQKLLILGRPELQGVDRVLWLDSDIVINDAAPCAVDGVPEEKIGAVQDQCLLSHPSLATAFAVNNGWHNGPSALSHMFYKSNGLQPPAGYHLNSGVLVASPKHHRELFEYVYRTHRETPHSYMEQAGLSFEIISRGLHLPIDPRFNALWLEYKTACYSFLFQIPSLFPLCIATALQNCFFLHFAGRIADMQRIDPNVTSNFGKVSGWKQA